MEERAKALPAPKNKKYLREMLMLIRLTTRALMRGKYRIDMRMSPNLTNNAPGIADEKEEVDAARITAAAKAPLQMKER